MSSPPLPPSSVLTASFLHHLSALSGWPDVSQLESLSLASLKLTSLGFYADKAAIDEAAGGGTERDKASWDKASWDKGSFPRNSDDPRSANPSSVPTPVFVSAFSSPSLPSLISLNLSRNSLTSLSGLDPLHLPSLTDLSLYSNKLPPAALSNLSAFETLHVLDLRLNPLSTHPHAVQAARYRRRAVMLMPSLKSLDLAVVRPRDRTKEEEEEEDSEGTRDSEYSDYKGEEEGGDDDEEEDGDENYDSFNAMMESGRGWKREGKEGKEGKEDSLADSHRPTAEPDPPPPSPAPPTVAEIADGVSERVAALTEGFSRTVLADLTLAISSDLSILVASKVVAALPEAVLRPPPPPAEEPRRPPESEASSQTPEAEELPDEVRERSVERSEIKRRGREREGEREEENFSFDEEEEVTPSIQK